jgi:NAD-dependent SIR2 family protein deacetylase
MALTSTFTRGAGRSVYVSVVARVTHWYEVVVHGAHPTTTTADDDNDDNDDRLLAAAVALAGRRPAILTGAGVSTDSGIPDYRGEGTRQRARRPVRFGEYVASDQARRRYWARACVGWPRIRDAQPNATHDAVARWCRSGRATGCITQNVDGLHQRAGATDVVELHGALRLVRCLACDRVVEREAVQDQLLANNPWFAALLAGRSAGDATGAAPDGDTDLDDEMIARFHVVDCVCGGALKPAVVFFGENAEAAVVQAAWRMSEASTALLVLGTSLEVWSGRRFVEAAAKRGLPIIIINRGPTRSDHRATVRIDGSVAEALRALVP